MSGNNHGGYDNDFEWNLDVTYDFESKVDLYFESDTNYSSDYDVDPNIDVCVDIEGNFAGFAIDVQAVGHDTATEVNLAVVTTDEYSSIALSGYSAVG